ncbi:hypothetical protein GCM10009639_14540 [Kitasatospora putterlickiae]|uniref:Secreted protein n=1 Tax=Kitasatospora putterlickiae TaxID=221725 RepID=A0ABP4IJM9_9ACTN
MRSTRARSARLAAAAVLGCLVLAPAASATPAHAPSPAERLVACNEAGTRQPGDVLMQVRIGAGGRFEGSYPGYTITRIEARTLLGTPLCFTLTDGGPGTDHFALTTAQPLGTVKVWAKRDAA